MILLMYKKCCMIYILYPNYLSNQSNRGLFAHTASIHEAIYVSVKHIKVKFVDVLEYLNFILISFQ